MSRWEQMHVIRTEDGHFMTVPVEVLVTGTETPEDWDTTALLVWPTNKACRSATRSLGKEKSSLKIECIDEVQLVRWMVAAETYRVAWLDAKASISGNVVSYPPADLIAMIKKWHEEDNNENLI